MTRFDDASRLLRKLRAAVAAARVAGVAPCDTLNPAAFLVQALDAGTAHVATQIPPRDYCMLDLERYPEVVRSQAVLIAALPASLYNALLPFPEKIRSESISGIYGPGLSTADVIEALELLDYVDHEMMHGKSMAATILQIVFEDQFLTPHVRRALKQLLDAHERGHLLSRTLADSRLQMNGLTWEIVGACHLCLSQSTLSGILHAREKLGVAQFSAMIGAAMQALQFCNELADSEDSISGSTARRLVLIARETKAWMRRANAAHRERHD